MILACNYCNPDCLLFLERNDFCYFHFLREDAKLKRRVEDFADWG